MDNAFFGTLLTELHIDDVDDALHVRIGALLTHLKDLDTELDVAEASLRRLGPRRPSTWSVEDRASIQLFLASIEGIRVLGIEGEPFDPAALDTLHSELRRVVDDAKRLFGMHVNAESIPSEDPADPNQAASENAAPESAPETKEIRATKAGEVREVRRMPGDRVHADEPVVILRDLDGQIYGPVAGFEGVITAVRAEVGQHVEVGAVLAQVDVGESSREERPLDADFAPTQVDEGRATLLASLGRVLSLSIDLTYMQREALLNLISKVESKPEFAVRRDWLTRKLEHLLPRDESWDDAWYSDGAKGGRAPPQPPPHLGPDAETSTAG
jgi:biotin carboxyl carrier protein